jgi:flagellar motor switch protein FliG
MSIIAIGISFIVIWLGTTLLIVRYVKRLKDDLFDRLSDTEKPSAKEEDKEGVYNPFDCVKRFDPAHLLNLIQEEHPQIIALVLAHLEPDKASAILQNLPHELQSNVSRRIATMDRVSPEVTREIEQVMEKKLSALSSEDYTAAGGIESIAEILSHADCASGNQIIEALSNEDPEIAGEINKRLTTPKKQKKRIIF